MDDLESNEDDMAALMGFSSFSEAPKPKRQKVSDPTSGTNSNNIPLGKPKPRQTQAQAESSAQDDDFPTYEGRNLESVLASTALTSSTHQPPFQDHSSRSSEVLLQKTFNELKPDDLAAFNRGVKSADGRTIFFRPRFIENNPWERLG